MGRLIILLAVIVGLLWFLHWFRRTPPHQVAAVLRKVLLWGGIGLVMLAALSGRLNPIFAALAAAVPVLMRLLHLMRMLPMLQQVLRALGLGGLVPPPGTTGGPGGTAGAGRGSSIRTRYLDMTLEHDSGRMDGRVREGPFAGRALSELELPQLLRMLELYQESDPRSASVLVAYLDREHGDAWRDAAGAGVGDDAHAGAAAQAGHAMGRDEALAILGLGPDADAEAIRAAHRRLMQKFHPDRGGSDYLAARINAAKALLLGD
ncbi:molecular chaperone DnaJ [Thiohalocapsa marina]|uniref:Molecular chaperone DnaJ n=1 Tax=Thiohalocapsa marina TaxID=424902 RepID=A0A5M8FI21_9GAMM|nr:molecular chaperone DnaJ [Thiohalocapsa marina]KAA6183406.1 molecular chaperone DnaJ [Thiohalocapsa marina]